MDRETKRDKKKKEDIKTQKIEYNEITPSR